MAHANKIILSGKGISSMRYFRLAGFFFMGDNSRGRFGKGSKWPRDGDNPPTVGMRNHRMGPNPYYNASYNPLQWGEHGLWQNNGFHRPHGPPRNRVPTKSQPLLSNKQLKGRRWFEEERKRKADAKRKDKEVERKEREKAEKRELKEEEIRKIAQQERKQKEKEEKM